MSLLMSFIIPALEKHLMNQAPEVIDLVLQELDVLAQKLKDMIEAKKQEPKVKS